VNDHQNSQRSESDAEPEREIRQERKFTLAEAIGRMAGPGAMKGESPVLRPQQAVAEIPEYLERHLVDAEGVLSGVLLRQVRESERLLKSFEQPLVALAGHVQQILGSEYALKELVREADVEWGRVFGERPCFDGGSCPPSPADPYTLASVRAALIQLMAELTARKSVKQVVAGRAFYRTRHSTRSGLPGRFFATSRIERLLNWGLRPHGPK
jgi:hypothetical protein